MSDAWAAAGNTDASPPPAPDAVTAGALLHSAREAAGLHVAALAVSLKVPVRKLEALENDRYDLLTDAVFVRALASSVCRTLKIDPQPVLDRLPHTGAPRLVRASDGINAPFRAPRDGAAPHWFEQLSKPVFLTVFALLLGALVLILLPTATRDERTGEPAGSGTAGPAVTDGAGVTGGAGETHSAGVTAADPAAAPALGVPPSSQAATPSVMNASLTTPAAVPGPAPLPATVGPGAAAPQAEASPGAAVPAGGIVQFRAKSPSWVEVTDANGVVAVRKLLAAGETASASGTVPMQVTIGRVDATEVQVRGKPFDLRPVTKDNVARFQVK